MIELIIIDGKVKNCEVLFECNSVDDLASFKMIREGVEVTPDNAPTFDIFDIKLIAEPRSPYGFSSLFKRNPNIDEWEYMGFGHSGACSVVTALLKQLQRKEQECEKLKEEKQDYCLNCDVAERMRKVVHAATGGRLSYANYTVDAIEQAYHDQLEIDVEYRTKGLKEENTMLQHKLRIATEALKFYSGTFPNGNKNTAKRVLEQIESEEQ